MTTLTFNTFPFLRTGRVFARRRIVTGMILAAGDDGAARDCVLVEAVTNFDAWTASVGGFAVSSGELTVGSLSSGEAEATTGEAWLRDGCYTVKVTFSTANGEAGIRIGGTLANSQYHAVVDAANAKIELLKGNLFTPPTVLTSANMTVNTDTWYTIKLLVWAGRLEAWVDGVSNTELSYDLTSPTQIKTGKPALRATTTSARFDDFKHALAVPLEPHGRCFAGHSKSQRSSGTLVVKANDHGGLLLFKPIWEDDVTIQAKVDLEGNSWGGIVGRCQDHNNFYSIELYDDNGGGDLKLRLVKFALGFRTLVASADVNDTDNQVLRVQFDDSDVYAWWGGTLVFDKEAITGTTVDDGYLGLRGWDVIFDDVKVGYDNNADGDIDDGGDDIVLEEDFAGKNVEPVFDDNGNMTYDGMLFYVYDAWNRLVTVKRRAGFSGGSIHGDGTIVAQYRFDALGRRIKKTVSKSGKQNATEYVYYDGQQALEVRNGSETVVREYLWGTQYLDEMVCLWVDKGFQLFAAHDANYNCLGLTDKAGNEVERYRYTPYGQVVVDQISGRGDFDGDGDVDAADNTLLDNNKTGSPTEAQLLYDLDGDGDVDNDDDTLHGTLTGSDYRRSGRVFSGVGNDRLFTMQTLDAEILNYHYKARWFSPHEQRFGQRDPIHDQRRLPASEYRNGMHRYQYSTSNPINVTDPTGFDDCLDQWNACMGQAGRDFRRCRFLVYTFCCGICKPLWVPCECNVPCMITCEFPGLTACTLAYGIDVENCNDEYDLCQGD